jgi:hypothetical protein
MPLAIDSSRAFRRIQELVGLVDAVILADPNDESDWIEWKAGLILANKDSVVQLARHILGMANRKVSEAARFAEGCGYIIVGAEPGNCDGITGIDPADLDSKIVTYTGADGPSWSPQYVPCQGVQVLVITVEPPRWGQRPFTLRKAYEGYNAGAIFVRRPGRTILAEPADIQALVDRYAAASQPFTLQVRPASAGTVTIHGLPSLQPLFDKWAAARQRELNPPPPAPPPEAADGPARGFRINPAFEQVAAAAATFQGMFTEPDRRTDAEIQREVEQYIQDSREYFGRLAVSRQVEHGYCLMSLELVNDGERSYADLHVEVQLSGRLVANNPEDLSPPGEPPEAPAPAGARRIKLPFSGFGEFERGAPLFRSPETFGVRPAFTITGSPPTVKYEIRHLRAEKAVILPPVMVDWNGEPASTLEASWTVTAGNADGVARGTFTLAAGEPSDLAVLLPELLHPVG